MKHFRWSREHRSQNPFSLFPGSAKTDFAKKGSDEAQLPFSLFREHSKKTKGSVFVRVNLFFSCFSWVANINIIIIIILF